MICTDCIKRDVCKHRDECVAYEKNIASATHEIFSITVECKHREMGILFRGTKIGTAPNWPRPNEPHIEKTITWCDDGTGDPPPKYK